ncbi:MAG: nucleotidyltransferase domain-containing protein [Bacteroidales bacterium]|nr:nucleotidyltransferase domain-containing protein [Bacteroidales bacterium]
MTYRTLKPETFPPSLLASELKQNFPEILFAFLFGSAQDGEIREGADIDLAVWVEDDTKRALLIPRIIGVVETVTQGVSCDLTLLNTAGVQLAFEALTGRELFIRNEAMDQYAAWYSLTCREYEDAIAWMKKQLIYRGYEVQWDH